MLKIFSQTPRAARAAGVEDPLLGLAREAAARKRDAMRRLLVAVGPSMLGVARTVLGPQASDAEDVLQDASEALLNAIASFRGECSVLHFACRVAVFSALAWRRRVFRTGQLADEADLDEQVEEGGLSPVDLAIAARRREALEILLDDLPQAQAEVLVLHCALDFTVEEIAAAVCRPIETVRSRLRLGKRALRDRIGGSPELAEILGAKP